MKQKLDANLIKKYHQDIVFNYAEYPTKDHWSVNFNSIDYQKAITEWFPKNQNKKISILTTLLSSDGASVESLATQIFTFNCSCNSFTVVPCEPIIRPT